MDLHGKIMNIPVLKNANWLRQEIAAIPGDTLMLAYKMGHRDARHAAAEIAAPFVAGEPNSTVGCEWRSVEDGDCWKGQCGIAFTFNDGGPRENGFSYCPRCGSAIKVCGAEAPEEVAKMREALPKD